MNGTVMARPSSPPATFPVLGGHGQSIPWSMLEAHEGQAQRNHFQTLLHLAGRGGLGWCEILAVLEDREWSRDDHAKSKVLAKVERWKARETQIEAAAKAIFARVDGRTEWAAIPTGDQDLFRLAARDASAALT